MTRVLVILAHRVERDLELQMLAQHFPIRTVKNAMMVAPPLPMNTLSALLATLVLSAKE
jgi:hypothetical protein